MNLEDMKNALSVSEICFQLRQGLEKAFPYVWVRGEVTDFKRAASGHIYFSLKDAACQLKCVWFLRAQRKTGGNFDPLTGEVYETPGPDPAALIQNGVEIICSGQVSFYTAMGNCQLVVDIARPFGEGLLAQAFQELKERLARAGLFDQAKKQPLPYLPSRIALITSAKGAAIHDFLELASNRGAGAEIRFYPALVQGSGAAPQIASAIAQANIQNWAEVIVVIRGGGSLEDLWAFNEEAVVRAIAASKIPVLTGIGHEIDTSLADLAADVAAATPSHAAQTLWPLRSELWQRLDTASMRMDSVISYLLEKMERSLLHHSRLLRALSPVKRLEERARRLAELTAALERVASRLLKVKQLVFTALAARRGPALRRQIAVIYPDKTERLARLLHTAMRNLLLRVETRLALYGNRLEAAFEMLIYRKCAHLDGLAARLNAVNPENRLAQGYALVFSGGRLVTEAGQCQKGSQALVCFAHSSLLATVDKVNENETDGWYSSGS